MIAALNTATLIAAPLPVPKVNTEPEPAWMVAFRKTYELKKDEYVKRVAPPYIPERFEFKNHGLSNGKDYGPVVEAANRKQYQENAMFTTVFAEQDGKRLLYKSALSSAYLRDQPAKRQGDNLLTVLDIVSYVTGLKEPDYVIDAKTKNHKLFEKGNNTVHGDWVVRRGDPIDKIAPQLEKILRDECKLDVLLTVEQEEHEVFVVSGKFVAKPPEWSQDKLLQVYATEQGLNKTYDHFFRRPVDNNAEAVASSQYSGTPLSLIRFVGQRVQTRMVVEAELPADYKLSWHTHKFKKPTEAQKSDDADPDYVLPNISEQTGLEFKKGKRKVPVLHISVG